MWKPVTYTKNCLLSDRKMILKKLMDFQIATIKLATDKINDVLTS